jgi:hypothetical protein
VIFDFTAFVHTIRITLILKGKIMETLPDTTETEYFTGITALNIPTEEGDFSDWHFTDTFLRRKTRLRIAGKDSADTTQILGSYGIRECSNLLRRYGVDIPKDQKVYSADFVRALLDSVYTNILENRIPFFQVDEVLDDESQQEIFFKKLQELKTHVKSQVQLTLMNQWESKQINLIHQ